MYLKSVGLFRAHSWVAGFCLAIPISYPSVPFYWLAFAVFLSSLFYLFIEVNVARLAIVLITIAVVVVSNILPGAYPVAVRQIIGTLLFPLFVYFGWAIPAPLYVIRGFFFACVLWSVLVLIAFLVLAPYGEGLLLFSVPEYRLWGEGYFPDWPNYFSFVLALGFLVGKVLLNKSALSLICLVAALLTTSRTPLIALFLAVLYLYSLMPKRILVPVSLVSVVLVFIFLVFLFSNWHSEFVQRLTLFSDRWAVFSSAIDLFWESPVFGNGSVLLDESVGNTAAASFHNFYLDILVRHGLVGLVVYMLLLLPNPAGIRDKQLAPIIMIILFFLVGSLFQNYLRHPHLVMMYSCFLALTFGLKKKTYGARRAK